MKLEYLLKSGKKIVKDLVSTGRDLSCVLLLGTTLTIGQTKAQEVNTKPELDEQITNHIHDIASGQSTKETLEEKIECCYRQLTDIKQKGRLAACYTPNSNEFYILYDYLVDAVGPIGVSFGSLNGPKIKDFGIENTLFRIPYFSYIDPPSRYIFAIGEEKIAFFGADNINHKFNLFIVDVNKVKEADIKDLEYPEVFKKMDSMYKNDFMSVDERVERIVYDDPNSELDIFLKPIGYWNGKFYASNNNRVLSLSPKNGIERANSIPAGLKNWIERGEELQRELHNLKKGMRFEVTDYKRDEKGEVTSVLLVGWMTDRINYNGEDIYELDYQRYIQLKREK